MFLQIISRLLDPFASLAVLFILAAVRSNMPAHTVLWYMLYLFCCIIAPVVGGLVWATKTKRITNYDVSDRRQRVRVLALLVVFLSVVGSGMYILFPFPEIRSVILSVLVFLLGFFLLTLKWKVSGHMAFATLTIGTIIIWYGPAYVPFLLILPFLAWLRLTLKRHTLPEVIGGTVYGLLFVSILYVLQ